MGVWPPSTALDLKDGSRLLSELITEDLTGNNLCLSMSQRDTLAVGAPWKL
jgi:hypothetical protein